MTTAATALAAAARAMATAVLTVALVAGAGGPARAQSLLPGPEEQAGRVRGEIRVTAEPGLEALAGKVRVRAPRALAAIQADLQDLPRPEKIEIRLVKRARDMSRAAPAGRGAPSWASGVAYPDLGVIVVATRRGPQSIDVLNVVDHELAHLALGAALGGRAPRWLDEGFAYLHSSDWSFERVRTLTGMVWFGNVLPLEELEASFPAEESEVHRAYAQSYDFVAFLARRGRYIDHYDDGDRWTFRRFLAEIAGGKSVEKACWNIYGASLDELFVEWHHDLRQRYLLMPVGMVAMAIWIIAAFLLILAYIRRRRLNRRKLIEWEIEESARGSVLSGLVDESAGGAPSARSGSGEVEISAGQTDSSPSSISSATSEIPSS